MNLPELRADCAACDALCCVALFIDTSHDFALGKPAGMPCRMLRADNRCGIHGEREARGFGGCVRYDCLGAGQRVTQLFAGRSWRADHGTLVAMCAAFSVLTKLHRLIELHVAAGVALDLSAAEEERRRQLLARLLPEQEWSIAALIAVQVEGEERNVADFLTAFGGRHRRPA